MRVVMKVLTVTRFPLGNPAKTRISLLSGLWGVIEGYGVETVYKRIW